MDGEIHPSAHRQKLETPSGQHETTDCLPAKPAPRALVVEDDPSWQQILAEILTDAGLEVDVADSLESANACLRERSHRLAVVDLSLGGNDHHNQDGLKVLEAVRRRDPGCVSLLVTGYATVELAVRTLTEYGAFTCLRKEDFRRDEFQALIARALASSQSLMSGEAERATTAPSSLSQNDGDEDQDTRTTVLIVEDDAGWRDILSELLTEAGYQVRMCSSFGEALGCLRREKYGVAVVDLSLASSVAPDDNLDGYRLLESTRTAGVPAIIVSGVATPEDIERAYGDYTVFAYLEKQSFDRRTFQQTVCEAFHAGQSPNFAQLNRLTRREREVLDLLAEGMTNKDIAEALVITTNTVKRHLKSIFDKLEVHTRAAAASKAMSDGLSR